MKKKAQKKCKHYKHTIGVQLNCGYNMQYPYDFYLKHKDGLSIKENSL